MKIDDHFDCKWYLNTYPDVSSAGVDPYEHFMRHGRKEGRLPHSIEAAALEAKALGGFSNIAITELDRLYRSVDISPYESSYAAWVLGKWYFSNHQWQKSTFYLESAFTATYTVCDNLRIGCTLVNSLLNQGDIHGAGLILQSLLSAHPQSAETSLIASNVLAITEATHKSKLRLSCINSIYMKAGFAQIALKNNTKQFSMDNLTATAVQGFFSPYKVSVLVPTYNSADYLATAVSGLLNQTWHNLEIIIVDDCSSDGTFELASAFASNDSRVIAVRHDENRGAYFARNTALSLATGEFITNHDSDDWSHPQRIQLSVESLKGQPDKVGVMVNWVRADENLSFQTLRLDNSLVHASVSTLMVRREVFLRLGSWDISRVGADSELLERVKLVFGKSSIKIIHSGIPLVFARHHSRSLTNATATHISSQYWGVRKLYRTLSTRWLSHYSKDATSIKFDSNLHKFRVPDTLNSKRRNLRSFDIVVYGDLGLGGELRDTEVDFIEALLGAGKSIAVFHWPDYKDCILADISDYFIDRMLEGSLYILSPLEFATTDQLLILHADLLATAPDSLPRVEYQQCELINLAALETDHCEFKKPSASDFKLIEASTLFSSSWYLDSYEDVAKAGVPPLEHYMIHGQLKDARQAPTSIPIAT